MADSTVPAPRGAGGPAFFIGLTGTVGALVALCAGYLVVRAAEVRARRQLWAGTTWYCPR